MCGKSAKAFHGSWAAPQAQGRQSTAPNFQQLENAFLDDSNFGSSMTNSAGEKPSAAIVVTMFTFLVKIL